MRFLDPYHLTKRRLNAWTQIKPKKAMFLDPEHLTEHILNVQLACALMHTGWLSL